MSGIRGLATTLLLAGFAVVGVWVVVGSLLLASAVSPLDGIGPFVAGALGRAAVGAALLAAVPGVALALRPRRRRAADVVATLYGVLVVGLTASQVREHELLLVPHLAGLALVLCAFPLGDRLDSVRSNAQEERQGDGPEREAVRDRDALGR